MAVLYRVTEWLCHLRSCIMAEQIHLYRGSKFVVLPSYPPDDGGPRAKSYTCLPLKP